MSKQRSRIIAAARERVETGGGIPALTLREIAATAGLPLGSVRHVFPSKDALLVALADDVVELARERQERAMSKGNLLNRTIELLPWDEQSRREARLELRMGLHATDATLSTPVQGAFTAAARESERLIRVTCGTVVAAVSREPVGVGQTFDQAGFFGLVEGLRFELIRNGMESEVVFGALRQHLTMLARKR